MLVASRNCPLTANARSTVASTQGGGGEARFSRLAPDRAEASTRCPVAPSGSSARFVGATCVRDACYASTRRPRRASRSGRLAWCRAKHFADTGGPVLCVEWTTSCARNRCYEMVPPGIRRRAFGDGRWFLQLLPGGGAVNSEDGYAGQPVQPVEAGLWVHGAVDVGSGVPLSKSEVGASAGVSAGTGSVGEAS